MLKERIEAERANALKQQETLRLSVLRMLSTAIHNREIEKRTRSGDATDVSLTDEEVMQVIRSELKKRIDAVAAYQQGNRPETAAQEQAEGAILQSFLPPELSDEELAGIIEDGMRTLAVSSEKDFGKLMGWVMLRVAGRASGDRVAVFIRGKLSSA